MLILASASPRRHELLTRIGLDVDLVPATVDETPRAREPATAYALRLARAKAAAVSRLHPDSWVLGADTVVVARNKLLGKAGSADEARAMLGRLLGTTHGVVTAFALVRPGGGLAASQAVSTDVDMRPAPASEIERYIASGEWRDKAGAYAVQGMAAAFVTAIRGSITNVIGLPLAEVVEALAAAGVAVPDYARGTAA